MGYVSFRWHRDAASQPPLSDPGERMGFTSEYSYIDSHGEQLYVVRETPAGSISAQVLIVGPFAPYRADSYALMARWSRRLASAGYEALRFDYRGVGESTGRFEEMTFSSWYEDMLACARLLRAREGVPLVLHGIGVGAVLASNARAEIGARALVLWGPPRSARAMLMDALRSRLAGDLMRASTATRKTREDYIAMLEAGEVLEVEDYRWTRALWDDSARWDLKLPDSPSDAAGLVRSFALGQQHAQLVVASGKAVRADPDRKMRPLICPGVEQLFKETVAWVGEAVADGVEPK